MTNGANIQYHDISKHDEEMKEPLDPESDLESIISPDATQTLPVDVSTPRQSRPQNEVTTAASQVELRTRSETKSVPKPTGSTARARNQELEALSLGSGVFTQLPVGSKTQDSNLAFPPNSQPERLNQYSRPAEQVKFVQEIETFQQQLDEEYRTFQASLVDGNRDATVSLVDCEQLEEQYSKEINSKLNEEKVITDDLSTRFQQLMLWMQISNEKEAERAIKRLRTRRALVEYSGDLLSQKQQHYTKVLNAFESAMALLGNL